MNIFATTQNTPYRSDDSRNISGELIGDIMDLNFGDAITALKAGKKVARSGWNGKSMFLYYVPANSYPAQTDIAKAYWGAKQEPNDPALPLVPYGAYIAMKTAQENVVPWLASQTDVLADDWQIIE